jgi:hypothetical protein
MLHHAPGSEGYDQSLMRVDAVQQRHQRGPGTHEGPHGSDRLVELEVLDGDEDVFLRSDDVRIVSGACRTDGEVAMDAFDPQPPCLDGAQVLAAGDQADGMTGPRQQAPEVPTNATDAYNGDLHSVLTLDKLHQECNALRRPLRHTRAGPG